MGGRNRKRRTLASEGHTVKSSPVRQQWQRRTLGARASVLLAVVVGAPLAPLVSPNPAAAAMVATASPSFPTTVTVGQTISATVSIANSSTPPESQTSPSLDVWNVDLVPACANTAEDCAGGVDAGVFRSATATGSGVGNSSCVGTWTVVETAGTFRLTPPGGNGSLVVSTGELCRVQLSLVAQRVPTVDRGAPPGIQTSVVVSATFSAVLAGPFRNTANQFVTVNPVVMVPPADFDGDGATDLSVYRPSNGVWYTPGSSIAWGAPGDIAVPADYGGDGVADRAVFRPSTGIWYVQFTSGGSSADAWGGSGDIPVPADYDGDGEVDKAVFRPSLGVWFVAGSMGGATSVGWGTSGDIPVPGDYDGDGRADRAVFRPSSGVWFVQGSSGGSTSVGWGTTGDVPVPGDYDGDGKTDRAVFRRSSSVWFVQLSGGGGTSVGWGAPGDIPVPGDYDGDGKTDRAVFRPSPGVWYVQYSSGGASSVGWGAGGDVPLPLPAAIGRAFFSPPFA